ncbi:heme A synthase [Amylibacter marinus]|uniref:Heme A synthase n=1 Tax=Amylibacter marinus TaxID=1475483 RepID=A0ABQ5VSV0_9RHOB|nr:heme A synthase [Amylibacter marinus]GLQ34404.1 heme A synthase [Amylibacter marinus]
MSKKRSIFEDVTEQERPKEKPQGGSIDAGRSAWRAPVAIWMMALFGMVALMVVVGGLTRLTDSGLSITEWNLIKGAVPPLNAADWAEAFNKYKEIPEFQLQNKGMDLAGFKSIYWWEWGHRQLGRWVGLVWFVGLVYFFITQNIPAMWKTRMVVIGLMGGLQGAIGWWMVSSGLTGRMVDVASYRLAVHLGLAFAILAVIGWYIMLLRRPEMQLFQAQRSADRGIARLSSLLLGLVFAQILLGALVAGIDAGRGYIDWPLMGGEFLPSESFDYEPFWSNFFENPALVQFNHRMLGYLVFGFTIFLWFRARKSAHVALRGICTAVLALVTLQMVLGIFTVMYAAPWHIAILHQLGAVFVMVMILRARFGALYPQDQKIRGA